MEGGERRGEGGDGSGELDSDWYRERLGEYKLEDADSGASPEKVGEEGKDFLEFREKILEDYGPEGLGEYDAEGQQDNPGVQSAEETGPEKPDGESGKERTETTAVEEVSSEADAKAKDGPAPPEPAEGKAEAATAPTPPDGTEAPTGATDGTREVGPDVKGGEGGKLLEVETWEDEHAAAGVGSYNRNDDQALVTKQEQSPGKARPDSALETPDLHGFPAGHEAKAEPEVEEVRTLEAVDYGKGAVLRVPKTDLEEAGFQPEAGQNSIVELGLKNAENEEVETVFARYVASDRRAEAYVGDIGGEKGSRYELVEAREYDEDRFVRDFERGKCEHLQNVGLEHAEDKLFLVVDNRKVELEDYRLSTSGSDAVLRGKIDGDSNCKIGFDGKRASVRFGRDYPVEGMRMDGDDLVVGYAQSRREKHEHRLYLEHLQTPEQPSLNQFGKPEMREHVTMFDHPERVEGMYQFVLDKVTQKEAGTLLDGALERGDNQYGLMKAEISERLVPNLLEFAGWERIEWHPFNESRKEGASANGTDWLLRTPDGKLVLTEVKWWTDIERAEYKGEPQVVKDLDSHQYYKGEKIVGAYVALVYWDVDDSPMKVYLKRVVPRVNLE